MRMDLDGADRLDSEVIVVGGDAARRRQRASRWGMLLVVFMRAMAAIWMLFGLAQWANIIWPRAIPFEALPTEVAIAVGFFAVADLVAAVGLWLAAPWGGALWLATAAGEALATILLPAYFSGGALTLVIYATLIAIYFAVTWLAAQEREAI
jgi:hypothetical protein